MKKGIKIVLIVFCALIVLGIVFGKNDDKNDNKNDKGDKKDIVSSDDKDDENNEVEISIKEQVLLDKNGIKITATEYVEDTIFGNSIKLLVENTTKATYTVGCDALIVNDYMISDLFSCEVASGKKATEEMHLLSNELEAAGIDTIGKIEMYLHAYKSDDYTDYLFRDEYSEIKTSAYDKMDTKPDDAGTELYNENGIRIVGKTVDEDSFWGSAILLYIENTSDKNVGISVDEMSINGFMMKPIFQSIVYKDKKAFDDITILSSDLEENGITSVDTVELKFKMFDPDTYTTILETKPITFKTK